MIAPAVPETPVGVNVIRAGVLKFARFSRLKISARNCRLKLSRSLVFFDGREVPRCQTRTDKVVALSVAEEPAVRGGLQENVRIEPLRRRPENGIAGEVRIVERPHGITRVAIVRRVIAELRGEWKPALQREDAVDAPAADHRAAESMHATAELLALPERQSYTALTTPMLRTS